MVLGHQGAQMQETEKIFQVHYKTVLQPINLKITDMKRTIITALAAMILYIPAFAEERSTADSEVKTEEKTRKKKEVKYNENGDIIKTGINFGPLPVVAFDADREWWKTGSDLFLRQW